MKNESALSGDRYRYRESKERNSAKTENKSKQTKCKATDGNFNDIFEWAIENGKATKVKTRTRMKRKNKTYTSIFGLFFYNQIIPSNNKINNFLTATRTERENNIFITLK